MQHLDRRLAIEERLVGEIHGAEAARADTRLQLELAQGTADERIVSDHHDRKLAGPPPITAHRMSATMRALWWVRPRGRAAGWAPFAAECIRNPHDSRPRPHAPGGDRRRSGRAGGAVPGGAPRPAGPGTGGWSGAAR